MATSRIFFIFAACVCLLGYAALSAAQGIPTAEEQAAKDVLSYPLTTMQMRVYQKDLSYQEISPTTPEAIKPYINSTQKILIHLHGYLQSLDDPFVYNLIRGFVEGYSYNVVGIDYRFCTYQFYVTSVLLAQTVGGVVLNAVKKLLKSGIDISDIILCGFSLGAQIVGYVARNLPEKPVVIGLDPAGPFFGIMEPSITASDGSCVICVHTDAGNYGTSTPCGHIDFYPNGGAREQPGCNFLSSVGACSHEKATEISAEAAMNQTGFPAIKCDSSLQFQNGNCNKSDIVPFGFSAPCKTSGKYYLQTNAQQPYARGMDGITYDSSIGNNFFG